MAETTEKEPPVVAGAWPVLGHMPSFGKNPFAFMMRARQEHGDVVEFRMFHQRMILMTGDEASEFFYRGSDQELDQSAAYRLMTPIFGEGVVFDAVQEKKDQQLKMLMPALRDKPMRTYAAKIVREVESMIADWGNSGTVELVELMKRLTIYTSSHCLLGAEFRYELNDEFARIYHDLERGVQPIAYIHPYLPLPSFRRRDRARRRLQELVTEIIAKRAESAATAEKSTDMFQMLIDARYEDGSRLTPHEITGMLIGAIFAGHHTSSGTAAWVLLELLKHPHLLRDTVEEVDARYGDDGEVTFDSLRSLPRLDGVLKEVLRLHPPLIMLMRKVLRDLHYKDYVIKAGRLVCAAPPVTHRIPELFPNPHVFDPDRYGPERAEDRNLNAWQAFGGGQHKCSGNGFAMFQIKTIFAVMLRRYAFELVDAPENYVDDYTQMIVQPKSPCRIRYRRRAPIGMARHRESDAPPPRASAGGCPVAHHGDHEPEVAIRLDLQLCQGHANCMAEAPELFAVPAVNDAKARLLEAHPRGALIEKARRAARFCPTNAIRVVETDKQAQ